MAHWAVSPSTVVVTLEGPLSRMADIQPGDVGLQAYVDVSNIFVDSAALPVKATAIKFKNVKKGEMLWIERNSNTDRDSMFSWSDHG